MATVQDDTRFRLIEAAGMTFADKGFDASGVREICALAKANVSAVKYYFGDKRKLYKAVLEHVHQCKENQLLQFENQSLANAEPQEQLWHYIHEMVKEHLASSKPAWHLEVMLWEMTRPTDEGREVVELQLRPVANVLWSILKRIAGDKVPDVAIWKCGFSIVGQILFYHVHQAIARQIAGPAVYDLLTVEQISQHIYNFSLAGIHRLSESYPE